MKKKRRKYRALEEAKGAQELQDGVVEGDLEEDGDEYEEESKTEATSTTR
jgi:hypothetical protein